MKYLLIKSVMFSICIGSLPLSASANNEKNCSSIAGSYLEGGRWKTRYTVNSDCTGTYCVQVLNNSNIPTSGYGWHCKDGRGTKKIVDWKVSNGKYKITFSNGKTIIRRADYLKKK